MTRYQKFVIAMLAFLQFTVILDFMTLSPLGAVLMPALNITTAQFGLVVSVYAFAAGLSGLLAAGFADRFDRKKFLLVFYCGFIFSTLLCGLATTYQFLLIARMITGVFGGVIGSVVFAIATDLFPLEMRGRVMGVVQTAFAASQVLGIPVGLYLSNIWDWHAPFLLIAGIGLLVGVFIAVYLKPIVGHLALNKGSSAFTHLRSTVTNPRYIQGFATTALLATGGFMLMPFGSAFSINNLGINLDHLPMLYMITGLCAMLTGPLVGRITDKVGKFKTFAMGTALSIVMVLVYTNLGRTPFAMVVLVNAILFVGISARMISSQALLSAVPAPASRGSFMSINSSIQQISGGIASVVAGMIISQTTDGTILHFDILGYIIVGTSLITLFMMNRIKHLVEETPLSPITLQAVKKSA